MSAYRPFVRGWIFSLGLVTTLAAGCTDQSALPPNQPPAQPAGMAAAPPAAYTEPHPDTSGYVAVVTAREAITLSARTTGTLTSVSVHIGDSVAKDAVIATIDEQPLRQELAEAQAVLRVRRAELVAAEVAVNEARQQLATESAMYERGVTSKTAVDQADFAHQRAESALARARAAVDEASARVSRAEAQLDHTVLAAPFSGTIAMRYADPGAAIQPGMPVVRLLRDDERWVRFAIPPEDRHTLVPGDPMIFIAENTHMTAMAEVQHVAPELDPLAQMLLVEARLAPEAMSQFPLGSPGRVMPARGCTPSITASTLDCTDDHE